MMERDRLVFYIGRYFGFWAGLDSGWDAGYREGLRRMKEIRSNVKADMAGMQLAVIREHIPMAEIEKALRGEDVDG